MAKYGIRSMSIFTKTKNFISNQKLKQLFGAKSYLIYILFIAVILLVSVFWFIISTKEYIFTNIIENYRYLLSTLAQTQAAIIALSVVFVILGVQFTSQYYSPRLPTLFQRNKFFWTVLTLYSTSIFYDIFLLSIESVNWKHFYVFISVVWFLINLMVLFPFVNSIFKLTNIENIFCKIMKKIDKSYREDCSDLREFRSIFEILTRAVRNDDLFTVSTGIPYISSFIEENKIFFPIKENDTKIKMETRKFLSIQISFLLKKTSNNNADDIFLSIYPLLVTMHDSKACKRAATITINQKWDSNFEITLEYFQKESCEDLYIFIDYLQLGQLTIRENEDTLFLVFMKSYSSFASKYLQKEIKSINKIQNQIEKLDIFDVLSKFEYFWRKGIRNNWRIENLVNSFIKFVQIARSNQSYDVYVYLDQIVFELIKNLATSKLDSKGFTIYSFVYFYSQEFKDILRRKIFSMENHNVLSEIITFIYSVSELAKKKNLSSRSRIYPLEQKIEKLSLKHMKNLLRENKKYFSPEIEGILKRAISNLGKLCE